MQVKARFRCSDVYEPSWNRDTRQVSFTPVYSPDPTDPNYSWSQATPSGLIQMTVSNAAAAKTFEVGKTYELTFEAID